MCICSNSSIHHLPVGEQMNAIRNAKVQDALMRSSACWQKAIEKKVPLPVDVVRCYDSCGDVTAIADTGSCSDVMESEVSVESSFTLPILPPPVTSTHNIQLNLEPLQPDEELNFVQEGEGCAQEEGIV